MSGKKSIHGQSMVNPRFNPFSSFLNYESRKILCGSLIQPYLDYCCSTWYSGLPKLLKNRLDAFQRRMVKFVFEKDMFYRVTSADMATLTWLSVQDRVRFFKLNLVFKIRTGRAPGYLSSNFVPLSHSHNTRRSPFDYLVSKYKTTTEFLTDALLSIGSFF